MAALILPEHADDYRAALSDRLAKHASIFSADRWLAFYAAIGRTWWQYRPQDVEALYLNEEGEAVRRDLLPSHVAARPAVKTQRKISAILSAIPNKARYAGWLVRDVLKEAETVATNADLWLGQLATSASRDVVPAPRVISNSRRKLNCWFPAIKEYRGPIGHLNRVLKWAAYGHAGAHRTSHCGGAPAWRVDEL